MASESQPSWIVTEFVAAYLEDRATGRVRRLREYLEAFPGDPEGVAREYAALEGPVTGSTRTAEDASPPSVAFPGRLGRYELERELGRGGQGRVFLARDTELGRKVAIKLLGFGTGSERSREWRRLEREAFVVAKLDHPALCAVYELGREEDRRFLAMRYVEGADLATGLRFDPGTPTDREGQARSDAALAADASARELLGNGRPGPERIRAIVAFFETAARALQAAHDQGVVHRDVKPSNIMVTPAGEPVLLDFGMAREVDGDLPDLTLSGDLFGTPAYMSPEQLTAQRVALDGRTDVYSLGVSLYEALTRVRPFETATRADLYQAILSKDPVDPRRMNAHVGADLSAVVLCSLEKDRDRRYASAAAFADDLRCVLDRQTVQARAPGAWLRFARLYQRHPGVAWSLTALFVVLVAGLGVVGNLLVETRQAKDAQARRVGELERSATDLRRTVEGISFGSGSRRELEVNSMQQALDGLLALEDVRGDDPAYRRELARTHQSLGWLISQGVAGQKPGRGVEHQRKALALYASLAAAPDATPQDELNLIGVHRELGAILSKRPGGLEEAASHLDEALRRIAAFEQGLGRSTLKLEELKMLAHEVRGSVFTRAGKRDEALPHQEKALAIARTQLDEEPRSLKRLENYLTLGQAVASTRWELRQLDGLLADAKRREALAQGYCALAPGNSTPHFILGSIRILKGNLRVVAEDWPGAAFHFQAARGPLEHAVACDPERTACRVRLRDLLKSLASVRFKMGQKFNAVALALESQWIWAFRPGADRIEALKVAQVYMSTKERRARRPDRSVRLLTHIQDTVEDQDEVYAADVLLSLADAYAMLGLVDLARSAFEKALPLPENAPESFRIRRDNIETGLQRMEKAPAEKREAEGRGGKDRDGKPTKPGPGRGGR